MSNKQIFSKIIPNIKLSTRVDADGNEIDVEIREDTEASQCKKKILDLLLSAGYFRVMIKNLSDFDKVIGGIVWCIEACEYDVDVDLLFHENLSIGQKIALTERVVKVLPSMKCPFVLEPHQIQGLDYINIFPVVQWLIKESVKLRTEKADRLKKFAVGQFHNQFSLKTTEEEKQKRENVLTMVKKIEDIYAVKRQYKRKQNVEPTDEYSRVRLTLLEYGVRNVSRLTTKRNEKSHDSLKEEFNDDVEQEQEIYENAKNLTEEEREEIVKHYENLKREMFIDAKQLSEQNQVKNLESMEVALEKRLQRIMQENEEITNEMKIESDNLEVIRNESFELSNEIKRLEIQEQHSLVSIKDQIKDLILQNEKMKQEEIVFKEECKQKIEELHRQIEEAEKLAETPDEEVTEYDGILEEEEANLKTLRLQLAKRNRAVTSLQRQLDNIPDSVELSQYQKRFLELYNQISFKHKETKQFYALFNTLNDKHLYLDKELTLLNSLYENYNQAMMTVSTKEQFLKKLEDIVEGVSITKSKFKKKYDDEKLKRDQLSSELLNLIELQRKYGSLIKKFKIIFDGQ
ncbi:hypothetical protein PVAND_008154 [Polypedilum vanderplanki]|uniref:Coiled-coil domain-containing protein 93 n=1 Tax=Polypedilum vanderplanki TaxID=319348 RepID=A0A9J6C987_POLVA|nr:hypothetical protein PVAND_008154 [Polypedilum vanderplanki]